MKGRFFSSSNRSTKIITISLLLSCFSFNSFSQSNRAVRWAFPNFNGLDFSTGNPVPTNDSLTGVGGSSAISDENGNLLFYSNGETVWQANGSVMQGGANLEGNSNATQSCIITPSPTGSTRYYLFTVGALSPSPNVEIHYYDVEMSLNGGNGGVIGPTLLLDTACEKIAATRHGNDEHYWVVFHRFNSNEFHSILIDQNGVNTTPIISSIGVVHSNATLSADQEGQMKISPDGEWIATCNFSSGNVQLFRFNNETGVVSDPITLASGITTFPYGCEFSADSKKFYYSRSISNAANPVGVHQFDLDHASIDCLLNSETVFTNSNIFKVYADLQLGIDKEIYLSYYIPTFLADTLGNISEPDQMCPDCDYEDNSLLLNHGMNYGLTNFVSSFLSDGITYEFGTNCENDTTWFLPEDTLALDSVRWDFGDPISGNNSGTQLNAGHVFSNAPDTFEVTLYSFRGTTTDTFTRNVIVWDTAVNLLGNDTTLCNGQPITLDATWYESCLLWSDSTTNNTYTTTEEGWHWVEVSHQSCVWRDSVFVELVNQPPQIDLGNDTSVCGSINFTIDPNLPNAFYTWQDGSHDTTYTVTSTGTYWLEASNACGTSSDTLNVEINTDAQPVLNFPDDTTICSLDGYDFDVSFIGAQYNWSDGFTGAIRTINDPGIYWVEVSNSCDTVSDTVDIIVDEPLFSNLVDRTVYCGSGDDLLLLATADSSEVNWSDGSTSPVFQVSQGGEISFEASNTCGTITDTIQIDAWDTNYVLNIGNDTVLCKGANPLIIGDTTNDYPWDYNWNTGEASATISAASGSFELTASHRCATIETRVDIEEAFTVAVSDSLLDSVLCEGEEVELSLNVDQVSSVEWSTGATTNTIVVTEAKLYSVDVIDTIGCAHSDSVNFSDFCPGLVGVSNIFTPNGDGLNDEFCVEMENIVSFSLTIYNRWGIELFYTEDQTNCWDGKVNGSPAEAGTYFYLVDVNDALGNSSAYRGSFALMQ